MSLVAGTSTNTLNNTTPRIAGDSIIVLTTWGSSGGAPTVTDSDGNTYVNMGTLGNGVVFECASCVGNAVGTNTITVTSTGATNMVSSYGVYRGLGAFDLMRYNGSNSDPTPNVPFTPATAGETCVAMGWNSAGSGTNLAGSGYTTRSVPGTGIGLLEDRLSCPGGAQLATFNNGGTGCCQFAYQMVAAVFKVKASGSNDSLFYGSD
jgi:hypothetical protein